MRLRNWLFGGLAALVFAGTAAAADFTFNVPVRLRNMPPDIVGFHLNVSLADGNWDQAHDMGFHMVAINSGPSVVLQNRSYTGVYVVTVSSYVGSHHPQEAYFYQIDLVLHLAPGKSIGTCGSQNNQTADLPLDLTKPCAMRYNGVISTDMGRPLQPFLPELQPPHVIMH